MQIRGQLAVGAGVKSVMILIAKVGFHRNACSDSDDVILPPATLHYLQVLQHSEAYGRSSPSVETVSGVGATA